MKTAKIFKHGNSQAVRLPKEFRFNSEEVAIKKQGTSVVLLPLHCDYAAIIKAINKFKGKINPDQPTPQERNWS